MKKYLIEVNQIQAKAVLLGLKKEKEFCIKVEQNTDYSAEERNDIKAKRIEIEMLIEQISSLLK